jgi:fucose permease
LETNTLPLWSKGLSKSCMRTCRHCGYESGDDVTQCAECGLDPGPSASHQFASQLAERSSRFLRRRVTSVLLIYLAVIYGISVVINLWLANAYAELGETSRSHGYCWAAYWNTIVTGVCLSACALMRRTTRSRLTCGACLVTVALFIVIRTQYVALLRGENPFPTLEAAFTQVPMLYAILYGLFGARSKTST